MARFWSAVLFFQALVASAAAKCSEKEWVDLKTPSEECSRKDSENNELELVFSDEFEVDGRTFQDGHDPVWTAITGYAETNQQKNAYVDTKDYATTEGGKLVLKADTWPNVIEGMNDNNQWFSVNNHNFSTPMLQTWNKFCFTEGVLEISAKFPGEAKQAGLWPGFWLMGNLGRATFNYSTEGLWPFSYDQCPEERDKEANQDPRTTQKINKCLPASWTKQYGLNDNQGRGAPEIDIIEAMPGSSPVDYLNDKKGICPALPNPSDYEKLSYDLPMYSTSLPIAPGFPNDTDQRPREDDVDGHNCVPENWSTQWYHELMQGNRTTYGENSLPNYEYWGNYFKGYFKGSNLHTDSLSAVNPLGEGVWSQFHNYTLEWKAGDKGYLEFRMDGKKQFHVAASTLRQERKITKNDKVVGTMLGRMIPEEPAYIMFNIDASPKWGWPQDQPPCYNCNDDACINSSKASWFNELCKTFTAGAASYEIDWIRLWQRPNDKVSHTDCSPKKYPTQGWIESHRKDYIGQNMNEPLRPVFAGGANCENDKECGQGTCKNNACNCKENWTGPSCRAKRAGASSICRSLENIVVGGAACSSNSSTSEKDCGRHGTCYKVELSGEINHKVGIQYHTDRYGDKTRVGGGDGRCGCESNWGGPTCNEQRRTKVTSPHPSWSGHTLENYVEKTCQQKPWFGSKDLESACNDVLWKHGGRYAGCGAWLRASWVAKSPPGPLYRDPLFWVVVIAAFFAVCCMPVLVKWGCERCRRGNPEQQRDINQELMES